MPLPRVPRVTLGSRHGDETLRRFLEEVSEGLPDLILQGAEKRLKAIQQLEENLSTWKLKSWGFFEMVGGLKKKWWGGERDGEKAAFFKELVDLFCFF